MIRSGLIGRSILQSSSPRLHEGEARAQGLDLRYELIDFTDRGLPDAALGGVLADLAAKGFAGCNVTYPFKQAVIPLLDKLDDSARRVEAVNTVSFADGQAIGYNTDYGGFRRSFQDGLPGASLNHVVQFGAGGAGAAVASALLSLGAATLELVDTDGARAADLAQRIASQGAGTKILVSSPTGSISPDASGIVNATPIGMATHPGSPISASSLRPDMWVADIVYFPLETQLLAAARNAGCRTLNGSGMVIYQATAAFEIISGHPANSERMRKSFG